MGSYLSQPKTEKFSTEEINEFLRVGASSMQGWRTSQEDAHNSILNFDKNTSFFAVYDGHGGAEVGAYCAEKLPAFLKSLESYEQGDFAAALKEAFLGFDKTLLEPEVVEMLKIIGGDRNEFYRKGVQEEDEEDEENLAELHEESHLSLNEVLQRYNSGLSVAESAEYEYEKAAAPSMPGLQRVKDGNTKPQSPFLRGRRAAAVAADAANKAALDPDAKVPGASTSAAAVAALNAGPSSSKSSSSLVKLEAEEPEEDSTVSSSSSSASKSNNAHNTNNHQAAEAEASSQQQLLNGQVATEVKNEIGAGGDAPDSSHIVKENEQNGSVTSTEPKLLKDSVTTTTATSKRSQQTAEDSTVSGSSDAAESKQNGNIVSSASSPSSSGLLPVGSPIKIELSDISSTSKDIKKIKRSVEEDSTDDDADYEGGNSEDDVSPLMYSSDEDMDEADEEDEEAEDEEDEEYDDEETEANKLFCANMIEEPGKDSGCTAVVALLHGRDLYVANAGDSRCVVCRNGRTIEMSFDHKPEDEAESERIIKAGGRVTMDGRVNGGLNLSRAIGDHAYKTKTELPPEEQMISALPDIKKLIISPDDEFMVLACDGIWNYMSSDEVVNFVRVRLTDESVKMSKICEELFDNCLAPNTSGDGTGCDNMTAVIVRFKPAIYDLPAGNNPAEVEKKIETESAIKALKRLASSSLKANDQDSKRLKTDPNEEESIASAIPSSTTITITTSSQSSTMTSTSVLSTSQEAEVEAESNEATAAAV